MNLKYYNNTSRKDLKIFQTLANDMFNLQLERGQRAGL